MKTLKWTAFGILCVAMLVVAAALCVAIWPGILVNERTLAYGARLAGRAGYGIRWRDASVDVESVRLLDKRFALRFTGLCVRTPRREDRASVEACFDHAALALEASFARLEPRLEEIGPLDLGGGRVAVTLAKPQVAVTRKAGPRPAKARGSARTGIPKWLARAVIRPIRVDIGEWRVERADGLSYRGALRLESATRSGGAARVLVRADARGRRPGERRSDRATATLELGNPAGFWRLAGWDARARASAQLGDGTGARADLGLDVRGEGRVDYRLSGSYLKGRKLVSASARGAYAPDGISVTLDGSARNFVPALRVVRTHGCTIALRRRAPQSAGQAPGAGSSSSSGSGDGDGDGRQGVAARGAVNIRCPVRMAIPVPPKGFPAVRLPTEAGMTLTADLATSSYPPSASSGLSGQARLDLDPILTPLLRGEGSIRSGFDGVPERFPDRWKMDTRLSINAMIPRFERLVAHLSGTPWDIPAPLRVLHGSMELGLDGRLDAAHGRFPVRFTSRLASPGAQGGQKLDIDASGDLTWHGAEARPSATLAMDVALSDVQLQLPRLEKKPPPRLYPDSRIHGEETRPRPQEPERGGDGAFAYSVRVHTPGDKPVRIVSNLTEKPVPIALDLTLASEKGLTGSVRVLNFPFEVFRRQAALDHFDIALASQTPDSAIDGAIRVPYTDYTVTILLVGTIGKPRMVLMSDPPLPEDQLWAVLLFGQPIEDLDPVQSETVGQTRGALADGVLGLPSMFLLASTPIQSLSYDPHTGQVSMKVRLAEGMSLNLQEGSSQLQSVGIRKRIGPHWWITTDVDRPPDSTGSEVSAFLEWNHRY